MRYPTSQKELLSEVRGDRTKTDFAEELGIDRSTLSRYESEELGASTKVLNYCLRAIAARSGQAGDGDSLGTVAQALSLTKRAVGLLEQAAAKN